MLGVLVNVLGILLGGSVGLVFRRGIPERVTKPVMEAIGLCCMVIGLQGAFKGENTLIMILSLALGAAAGSLIDIDRALNRLGEWTERKLSHGKKNGKVSLAEGMVNATLLFCVGAMAIVGSLNAGLLGDNSMLYTKALLDCISAMMFAVTMGPGVLLSAIPLLLYQGGIALLAGVLRLSDPIIAELTCTGSVMILALGFNLVGITKIKVANLLPGLLLAPLLTVLFGLF